MLKVLFTAVGRRVALLRSFRRAFLDLDLEGVILATDMDPAAPGLLEADRAFLFPDFRSESYLPKLLEICEREGVNLLIPLIDPELPLLAQHKETFESINTVLVLSSLSSVSIANDKLATFAFFKSNGIPCVSTRLYSEDDEPRSEKSFPLVVKPRYGSSGQGVTLCSSYRELEVAASKTQEVVIQPLIRGPEVTIDLFGDGTGRLLSAVPRQRLKIRGGEVERAITIEIEPLMESVLRISSGFKPYGPVNVQCFITDEGPLFTEINARFGGGYPLTYAAGADFPRMIIEMFLGRDPESQLGNYTRGLVMSRYDEAFFTLADDLPLGKPLGVVE
ncbi:MAG: ATP-grasp domain-containing protein [Clostridia bacterium]|nr:ATP-grasp domain-containing protein [Clostridia bacterium]